MSASKHLLCHWHSYQNVKTKGATCLKDDDDQKAFMKAWNKQLYKDEINDAREHWKEMSKEFEGTEGGTEAIEYVETNW